MKYLKLAIKHTKPICFNEFSIKAVQVKVSPKKISAFRRMFACSANQPLPHSFAFIGGFPTLLSALAHKHFAFSPIGLIHLRAKFESLAPIDYSQHFDIEVQVSQQIHHPLGNEIQVKSIFYQQGKCCMINTNTLLKKTRSSRNSKSEPKILSTYSQPTPYRTTQREIFHYAKISGDYNPIHLHDKLAVLFGMPKAIVHGLFLGHLVSMKLTEPSAFLQFDFKKACPVGTQVGFINQGDSWQVFSANDTLHLVVKTQLNR